MRRRSRVLAAYVFLAPALVMIGLFTLVPFVQGILLSFQSWDGVSVDTPFVGLANYQWVMHDSEFWGSMKNAAVFGVVGLVVANAVSMGMALAVHRARRGRAFFRTVYYLPGVFSTVVVGVMFSWFLDPNIGIVNQALKTLGLDGLQHNWLGDPKWSLIAVAAVFVWYHWGFGFILFLAGRQDVPKELYEAASLDGARGWAQFRHITWPGMSHVTGIVSVLTLLSGLQIFGTVQVLTNGGPAGHTEVPTLHIYQQAFQFNEYGRAAAMSVIFGACLVVLACVQLWVSRRLGGSTDSRAEKGSRQ
ncbi:carbohydrate ABC transporter permease [Streptomyces sp. NPDC090088]|uniref:carbohydrate ABC transporter permease n=1 Tax=Streptomyces sp. NPDC090088 TaxID=3365944 RepID=UPI0037FD3478